MRINIVAEFLNTFILTKKYLNYALTLTTYINKLNVEITKLLQLLNFFVLVYQIIVVDSCIIPR